MPPASRFWAVVQLNFQISHLPNAFVISTGAPSKIRTATTFNGFPLSLFLSGKRGTINATTLLRPSASFLQPTSKPKGVAAGRNPNPFVFGQSRCCRSAPRSWTRYHQANPPPHLQPPLLILLVLPLPKRHQGLQQTCSVPQPFPGRAHVFRHQPPRSRPLHQRRVGRVRGPGSRTRP